MGTAKPARGRTIHRRRPAASTLARQLTELTTQLNSLDPTELQPQELAAINELVEQLRLDFDAKKDKP
jgi:hypothetical protein